MENKKYYVVLTPFFPDENSFVGAYIYDQVCALIDNSHYEVVVIKVASYYDSDKRKRYEYQGVPVNVFRTIDLPSSVLFGLFHSLNVKRFENYIRKELKLNINDIEVIHSHVTYPAGYIAVSIGKKYDIKNIIQHHGRDVFQLSNGRILKGVFKSLNNTFIFKRSLNIVNNTDINVGVSQITLDQLKKHSAFTNESTYVLYNGVNTQKFHKLDNENENSGIFTIGCIGNFWKSKDQMTLVKAVHELTIHNSQTNIVVKFIGNGEMRDRCEAYIELHKLEKFFIFLDEVDHTKLNVFYNTLKLFVLPSYDEALGCVYMEALEVGIPIIGIKGQGIEEVLYEDDKDHFLINKKDYIDLAKKISFFMDNVENLQISYTLDINQYIIKFLKRIEKI
jgi:glycosyltransferase involved in cell wall biosynthesis